MRDVTDLAPGAIRYALGVTLAIAAGWKIRDFAAFRGGLVAYGLPAWASWVGAPALVAAEATTAVLSFTRASDAFIGALATGLGSVFLCSQVYLLATGNRASCLCFGRASAEATSVRTATRAGLVLVAALALLFTGSRSGRALDLLPVLAAAAVLAGVAIALRWLPEDGRADRAHGP